jgi:hypothetical protein
MSDMAITTAQLTCASAQIPIRVLDFATGGGITQTIGFDIEQVLTGGDITHSICFDFEQCTIVDFIFGVFNCLLVLCGYPLYVITDYIADNFFLFGFGMFWGITHLGFFPSGLGKSILPIIVLKVPPLALYNRFFFFRFREKIMGVGTLVFMERTLAVPARTFRDIFTLQVHEITLWAAVSGIKGCPGHSLPFQTFDCD